jgi:hypothetical protein
VFVLLTLCRRCFSPSYVLVPFYRSFLQGICD